MSLLAHCLVALALAADAQPKQLTTKTPELTVTLEAKSSWTIRSLEYQGARLIIPAGGQGAVLLPKGGKWTGSAMGKQRPRIKGRLRRIGGSTRSSLGPENDVFRSTSGLLGPVRKPTNWYPRSEHVTTVSLTAIE